MDFYGLTAILLVACSPTLTLIILWRAIHKLSDKLEGLKIDLLEARKLLSDAAVVSQTKLNTLVKEHSRDICRVMVRRGDKMVPGPFVQEGSGAWKEAYNTPGKVIVRSDGTIEKGVQR